jgi:Arc/MetJ-type ribon-helix-helix transcriptional regulator
MSDLTPTSAQDDKLRAAKISVSMPEAMVDFIDQQCRAFRVGRSTYLQMLLEAEQHSPRKEFTKRALD